MNLQSLISFLKSDKFENLELEIVQENHNLYYEKGTELITPYIKYSDKPFRPKQKNELKLKAGIKYLDAVTKLNPENDSAYWVKGKAYQAMNMHKEAYDEFNQGFKLNKENPDFGRELAEECLYLGFGKAAVSVSKFASSLDPNDAGLLGNVALSYLINGELLNSKQTIRKAMELDPDDEINKSLNLVIEEVVSGKRKRPNSLRDLGY